MTEPSTPAPGGGRRRAAETARTRPSPVTILAVLIPLLTVAALALVRPAEQASSSHAPAEAPLDRVTAVCPARLPGADEIRMGTTGLGSGDLTLRVGRRDDTQTLSGGVASRTERQYVVINGSGELAPGLVASRSGDGSATGCDQPAPERWFTGAGASAEHTSTLTLINPDRGPAVADVTVWDGSGLVDVPALRGVRVPGGRSTSFDLSEVAPNRDALALRVSVSRGRLASSVVDVVDPVGRDRPVREWLPAQAAPASTSYVAGIGTTAADRVLTLANPGDSEVRVALELVSEDSEFAPVRPRGGHARPGVGQRGRPQRRAARPRPRGRPGAPAGGDRPGHRLAPHPHPDRPRADAGGLDDRGRRPPSPCRPGPSASWSRARPLPAW